MRQGYFGKKTAKREYDNKRFTELQRQAEAEAKLAGDPDCQTECPFNDGKLAAGVIAEGFWFSEKPPRYWNEAELRSEWLNGFIVGVHKGHSNDH